MGTLETADAPAQAWKVGALARATGLTVRALHYYDEIGLLRPSRRSSAGHRLYDAADVARLYRISLLRRLGFPLEQITSVLEDPEWQLAAAVDRHLGLTQHRAASAVRLCARLTGMAAELARQESPSPEQMSSALEEMTMLDSTIHSTTGPAGVRRHIRGAGLHRARVRPHRRPYGARP
jgi:MerR family transcriptional regulator, thiopeptide resistance regulator